MEAMVHALTELVRDTLCGRGRPRTERARFGPGPEPDQAAQQPRARAPPANVPRQPPQRRLIRRPRQRPAPGEPHRRGRKRLPPPHPPALQRRQRHPPPARDRPEPRIGRRDQYPEHHEQRSHPETAPEEPHRRRRRPAPALRAAEAEPASAASQLRRQTVRLARVGCAVQHAPAAPATPRTAPCGLRSADALERPPDTGIGKIGTGEKFMRHWATSQLK